MPGFIEMMERTQREAYDLHHEARQALSEARAEASQIRAAASSEAALIRDRAVAEAEWLRRDTDRLWATFSRFLAAAGELVNVLGPLAATRSDGPESDSAPAETPAQVSVPAPEATQPPASVSTASEADLLAAEQDLRDMLEKTRHLFPAS